MNLLSNNTQLSRTFAKLLHQHQYFSFAVAWASREFASCDLLLSYKNKIQKGIVGTSFYHTDPKFIEAFRGDKCVRFVPPYDAKAGLFHPKLYVFFSNNGTWDCIIGSANFTAGAFQKNSEISVHLCNQDDPSSSLLRQVEQKISDYWGADTLVYADEIDLAAYTPMWARHRKARDQALGKFGKKTLSRPPSSVDLLKMNWDEFVKEVGKDQHHTQDRRLQVLKRANQLFQSHTNFSDLTRDNQKAIAGFKRLGTIDWGWFGSTTGAGWFKGIINSHPEYFDDALRHIPMSDSISKEAYMWFIKDYCEAFRKQYGSLTGHGLPTATRLLAMKRPDYFLVYNRANESGLSVRLGYKVGRQDYEGYWDSILEPVFQSNWWTAPPPTGAIEQQIWNGRMAMLDVFFYTPSN